MNRTLLVVLVCCWWWTCSAATEGRKNAAKPLPQKQRIEVPTTSREGNSGKIISPEAGTVVSIPGFSIDVKLVRMDNDDENLLLQFQVSPELHTRAKEQPFTVSVLKVYFDTDMNPRTGSTPLELDTYGYENGYEYYIDITSGALPAKPHPLPTLGYALYRFRKDWKKLYARSVAALKDRGPLAPLIREVMRRRLPWSKIMEVPTAAIGKSPLIGYEKGIISVRIPIERLGLKRGMGVRMLLVESASDYTGEGYSVHFYELR